MAKQSKSAAELRAGLRLGDNVVKEELDYIDEQIDIAAANGQMMAIIEESPHIAGKYSYGDWWFVEKIFDYDTWRGLDTHNGVVERVPGITSMTMEEVQELITPEMRQNHNRIKSILRHYRNLGYNIHPGNWYSTDEKLKVKWVVDWSVSTTDHIYIVDDTLVIGQPEEYTPIGKIPAPGEPHPVHPKIRIDFFGSGNTGVSRNAVLVPEMEDVAAPSASVTGVTEGIDLGDGTGVNDSIASAISTAVSGLAASMNASLSGYNEQVVDMFNQMAQNKLIKPIFPVPGNESVRSGVKNIGDGVFRDLENIERYGPGGEPLTDWAWIESDIISGHGTGGSDTNFAAYAGGSLANLGPGTIWKPVSESRQGRVAILLPSNFAQADVRINGQPTEFTGFTNGNRGTYFGAQTGSAYQPRVKVTINDSDFYVDNPSQRIG